MKNILTVIILLSCSIMLKAQANNQIVAYASDLQYKIDRNIYGHFSEHLGRCIYGGIWVGPDSPIPNINGIRKDVAEALKEIKVPVLRWPGGCFADEYHWKDGIGPRDQRPKMINTNWGGVTEDNSFGTHEFLELCDLIGSEPYFTGNVGSGTVQEFSQWIEYVNSDNVSPMTELRKRNGREKSWGVKYWAVGNEAWGCGGNMRPEFYSDMVRRFGTYLRTYGNNKVYKIACGPSGDDFNWTEVMMKNPLYFDGLALHHYSFANTKIAIDFDENGWFDIMKSSLRMDDLITKHSDIMDKYDWGKRIALIVDEWGTWFKVEEGTNPGFLYQQNTLRDAIAAACNLNIFNNHCDRVRMANIAQIVNVLQSMILTEEKSPWRMVLTPTYHVFNLFKVHQDAMLIPTKITNTNYTLGKDTLPAVNCSASIDDQGKVHISLCNINPNNAEGVSIELLKFKAGKISGRILTSGKMNAHNTFDNPNEVVPDTFADFQIVKNNVEVNLPPMSVVVLELEGTLEMPPAIELTNPKQGINSKYYEGRWDMLPPFNTLSSKSEGVIESFTIPAENSGENFAVQYDGYIKIPKDGLYTFYINSDDGTELFIDNKNLVVNDGRHAPEEKSNNIILKEGYHEIKVTFFQAAGGMVLDVSMEGPGMDKQIIPKDMLFQKE
jgi:alpha-N-arabinofuranosidase